MYGGLLLGWVGWVAYKILVTAQRPNSPFLFGFDWDWNLALGLSIRGGQQEGGHAFAHYVLEDHEQ